MAFVIRTEHPLYQRAARREAATWGRPSVAALRAQRPLDHPVVQGFHRSLIVDGESGESWVEGFVSKYGPFRSALSLGCGTGTFEERILATGAVERLHVVDLSPEAVRSFQGRLAQRGLSTPVSMDVADLNELELQRDEYDLVVGHTSLHHLINLEHVFEQVRLSLREGGIFVVRDFVGPNVWQWPDETLDEVNRFIESTRHEYPTLSFNRVQRPKPGMVKAVSPFESVRSGDIVGILRLGFEVELEALTDRLLFVLINYGIQMSDWENRELDEWLGRAIARERELGAASNLPACMLWGIYRRGATAIAAGTPWSEQEIKSRIGVSRFSATGMALSVIDRLPARDRIIRTLTALQRKLNWN